MRAREFTNLTTKPVKNSQLCIHALAYSFVGAQTLYLGTHWHPIYWDTACLIVNSGSLEEDTANKTNNTDYGKIAKALNDIIGAGINVSLVDINNSDFGFKPDVQNNRILFGLKAVLNVNDDLVKTIIDNRPYKSIKDFYYRIRPTKQPMVSLIKAGAFDNMMNRKLAMAWFIWETCDKKNRLTLQNMATLIKRKLLPLDTEEQRIAYRVYEFNRYLKDRCKTSNSQLYSLDNRALSFLSEMDLEFLINDNNTMLVKSWEKQYQLWMDVFRFWIKENNNRILTTLNEQIFAEDWEKYAGKGNISSWEMQVLCFYYHEHELANVNKLKYGLMDFNKISENPVIDKTYKKGNREIHLFKLYKICGTCIAKNKTKSIVTLLTTSGVVNVKFRKEYFALFDKQISEKGEDGKKHVIEHSWFERGSMIVVQGIRSGDDFVAKKYASSNGHQLYKIIDLNEKGDLMLQHERSKQGEMIDD